MPPRERCNSSGIVNVVLGADLLAELDAWAEERGVGKAQGGRSALVAQAVRDYLWRHRGEVVVHVPLSAYERPAPAPATRMGEVSGASGLGKIARSRQSRRRAPKL